MSDLPDSILDYHAMGCQLIQHEGFVPHAYQDSLGWWTIGIGRLIDKRKGGGITREEALYLLRNDIEEKVEDLDYHLPWWRKLDGVRQRALLDMAFNLGIAKLLTFKTTLSLIKAGNYEDAATAMLQSKWARQVGLRPGQRAHRLASMMRTGEPPTDIRPC
ncbi:MAG: hypothetical protein HMLKMBBP_01500 [Planctomycetes bacterium]|nr:hypothetical protein [Planctomycetota bacterium]